jgi:hypothetical protein
MADAGWLPDPSGAHELRYWDGGTWTEHVSDAGATSQDPPSAPLPPPAPPAAVPPPPPPPLAGPRPAETVPAGKVSWKDRLKQVADQGKAAVDQGKAKLAEQGAKRAEQWANDPSTLWYGESQNAATSAAGVAKARYRITRDRVWIESGLLGTRTESVPLWAIRDMDVRQAVWQRDKDVGDVVLNLEDPAYGAQQGMFSMTGGGEHGRTSGQAVLDNIERPFAVLELLAPLVSEARTKKTIERQSQYVHVQPPMGAPYPAPMAPPMAPPVVPAPAEPSEPKLDLADQLRKLADLRDAGVLTDDEFSSQKAKLLG